MAGYTLNSLQVLSLRFGKVGCDCGEAHSSTVLITAIYKCNKCDEDKQALFSCFQKYNRDKH